MHQSSSCRAFRWGGAFPICSIWVGPTNKQTSKQTIKTFFRWNSAAWWSGNQSAAKSNFVSRFRWIYSLFESLKLKEERLKLNNIAGVSGATLHWASKECWSLLSWGLVTYLSEAVTLGLVIIIVMSDMQLCMVGWTKMSRQPTPLSLSTFSSCFRLEVKSQLCAKSI